MVVVEEALFVAILENRDNDAEEGNNDPELFPPGIQRRKSSHLFFPDFLTPSEERLWALNPFALLFIWKAAFKGSAGWAEEEAGIYYLLLPLADTFLHCLPSLSGSSGGKRKKWIQQPESKVNLEVDSNWKVEESCIGDMQTTVLEVCLLVIRRRRNSNYFAPHIFRRPPTSLIGLTVLGGVVMVGRGCT